MAGQRRETLFVVAQCACAASQIDEGRKKSSEGCWLNPTPNMNQCSRPHGRRLVYGRKGRVPSSIATCRRFGPHLPAPRYRAATIRLENAAALAFSVNLTTGLIAVMAVGGNNIFGLLGTISAAARWSRMAVRYAQSAHDKQDHCSAKRLRAEVCTEDVCRERKTIGRKVSLSNGTRPRSVGSGWNALKMMYGYDQDDQPFPSTQMTAISGHALSELRARVESGHAALCAVTPGVEHGSEARESAEKEVAQGGASIGHQFKELLLLASARA
jgi:hypothetical protein